MSTTRGQPYGPGPVAEMRRDAACRALPSRWPPRWAHSCGRTASTVRRLGRAPRGQRRRRGRPHVVWLAGDRRARRDPVRRRAPRRGEPVVLVPGFLAGDVTLRLMAGVLRRAGYRTYRSQIHANVGCTLVAAAQLEARLEAIALRRGCRVRIVGHSLGGMLARGLAVRRPDLVSGIVTLGSPMLAPAAHHASLTASVDVLVRLSRAGVPGLMAEDCVAGGCARQSFDESRRPVPRRVSASPRSSRGATGSSTGGRASTRWPSRRGHAPRTSAWPWTRGSSTTWSRRWCATGSGRLSARSRSRRKCVASAAGARR